MRRKLAHAVGYLLLVTMIWLHGGARAYAEYSRFMGPPAETVLDSSTGAALLPGEEFQFDSLLSEIKDLLERNEAETRSAPERGFREIGKLRELKEGVGEENEKIRVYFDKLGDFIKRKGLSGEILDRHEEFVRQYQAKYQALEQKLGEIESTHKDATGFWGRVTGKNKRVNWDGVLGKALVFLKENSPSAPKRRFDPKNLPNRTLRPEKPVLPKLTIDEWRQALPEYSGKAAAPAAGSKIEPETKLFATAPPTTADLAETVEVKFTQDIKDLADSLGRNPVKIFNWVRNNIEFVPTWGSIQGAQLCLENRAGNAFDTASLLVALLRYSGIHARYQMGTIEVPIEKFKNWAGGFTSAEAAASLFASAGVPSVVRRFDQSGKVAGVKLEHIWVKGFVDYIPSAAAVQLQSDTWVDMDPSFKQFEFTARTDFTSALPSDLKALSEQLLSGAIINKDIGSATRLNTATLSSAISTSADQIRQSQSGLTVEQVLANLFGSKKTRQISLPIVASSLPYKRLVSGGTFASIPEDLRHTLTVNLEDQFANVLISFTRSLPAIGGSRLALNYLAASSADANALVAFGQAGATEIPSTVSLKPEFRLNEQTITSGNPVRWGSIQVLKLSFTAPTITTPEITNPITAGEQLAIGLNLGRISSSQLTNDRAYFQNVEDLIDNNNLGELARQNVGERMLNQIIWMWFFRTDLAARMVSDASDAITIRYPSAGICFFDLEPTTLFGAVRSAKINAVSLDVDRDVVIAMSKNGSVDTTKRLTRIQGSFGSALEALVMDQFFSRLPEVPKWVSTITLLNRANSIGVPILTIDQANSATALPVLNLSPQIEAEIADAVNAGLAVTVPQEEVSQLGFRGVGYIVEDAQTGSAAYLISGGLNGASFAGPTRDETGGACLASSAVVGGVQTTANAAPTEEPCDDTSLLRNFASFVIWICANLAGVPGLGSLVNLLRNFADALYCLADQGVNGSTAFTALGLLLMFVFAAAGVLAVFSGAITGTGPVIVIIALVFVCGFVMPLIGGCPPPTVPTVSRNLTHPLQATTTCNLSIG